MSYLPLDVSESQQGFFALEETLYNGVTYYQYYVSRMKTRTTIQKLAPESRPKPQNLRANLTDRALQWTESINTGYTETYQYVGGYLNNKVTRDLLNPFSDIISNPVSDPDWITPMRNQVNGLSISLGQDLAEYRQSADLFSKTAGFMQDAFLWWKKKKRALRKVNITDLAALDIINGFGVQPLVGLLNDSIDLLHSQLHNPTHVKLVQRAVDRAISNDLVSGGFDQRTVAVRECFAKAYISFVRPPPAYQFGNAASIAWEVIPYSFLIDYMIPIGDYLSALDALIDVGSVYGTVTTRDRSMQTCVANSSYSPYLSRADPGTKQYNSHKRDVITSIPPPPLPKWKPSPSYNKLRHAVSLLILQRGR